MVGASSFLCQQEQDALVAEARRCAMLCTFDGRVESQWVINFCRHEFSWMGSPAVAVLTRDVGYHSGGWWKNPDYERCWHLSVSFADGFTRARGDALARLFFSDDARLTWIEGPYSDAGRRLGAWHYRLFCDPAWRPLKPRGEVYSRFMPKDWMSFSEQHQT